MIRVRMNCLGIWFDVQYEWPERGFSGVNCFIKLDGLSHGRMIICLFHSCLVAAESFVFLLSVNLTQHVFASGRSCCVQISMRSPVAMHAVLL